MKDSEAHTSINNIPQPWSLVKYMPFALLAISRLAGNTI